MKKSTWSRDLLVMLAALCVAGVAVVWVQRITGRIDGVAMLIFMLAVFVTSMYTDGYLWGVLASLASVLAVNFAFFTPYFAFNFTLPENLFSGLVMLAVSIMTSTLTTRVKKQEQLRMETEREKMRANLLRAVSHDLRTPLTSIYGACSTVTENYDSLGKEQALKLLREACEDAQWLNRMVENLLSVTRFDGEQVAVKKTPTVLEELLDAVLVKFKKRCPDVPVQLELPEDFVMIPMDSMLIQQVLMNLLENALEASLRTAAVRRQITVTAYLHAAHLLLIEIENPFDGTVKEKDGVFRSSKRKGDGVGLRSVRHIAERSGGASTFTYQDGVFRARVMLRG